MSPIGKELRDSLQLLDERIIAAEKALRKMPGAELAHVFIEEDGPFEYFLSCSRCAGGEVKIVEEEFDGDPGDVRKKVLMELPVMRRIDRSKHIDRLLVEAKLGEAMVASQAEEAADKIEIALIEASKTEAVAGLGKARE